MPTRGLEYELVPNGLTGDAGDYSFKVVDELIHPEADVIDAIVALCPSVKREQVVEVFDAINKTIAGYAANVEGAQTRFMHVSHSLHGTAGPDDMFNHLLHKALVNMLPGKEIAEAGKNPAAHKVPFNEGPAIVSVTDLLDDKQNSTIRKGHLIRIVGRGIKLVGEGAYVDFVNALGGTYDRIYVNNIPVNKPSEVMLTVPLGLTLNKCRIRVATAFSAGNNKPLKTLREATFNVELTVLAANATDGDTSGRDSGAE
jgi:hypothetical protein